MPLTHRVRIMLLCAALGIGILMALVAPGAGPWAPAPISAQRSTVPTRTPTAPPEAPTATPEPPSPTATPPAAGAPTVVATPAGATPTPIATPGTIPSVGWFSGAPTIGEAPILP